ncbi:MAG: zinc ABC transporter substrate-binding protein [Petrimonas sp.]|nr:zinc ABC transporter substrate-binding protein [Petrimonas sp.]
MKKITYLLLISTIVFAGCKTEQKNDNVLSVTIEPQRFFLEKIVGEAYKINVIVPPGTSPETYEPTPAMMMDLGRSKMYFKVGALGFENAWSKSLAENNPDVTVVDCSRDIGLIYGTHNHDHEADDHDAHADLPDAHVWSSPKTAAIFAENMYKALVFSDAENVETYKTNFDALKQIINQTDSSITALLSDIPSRSFIIYHPALSYFARDYGLEQHSIEFEGKSPSPAQIKELVDLAKREDIKVIFVQQGFDAKNAEVVANEIGAKVYKINPLAYEWDKELIRIAKILAGKTDE